MDLKEIWREDVELIHMAQDISVSLVTMLRVRRPAFDSRRGHGSFSSPPRPDRP
jgi:hypothetical protein